MGDYGKEASESCSQHCVALDDDAQYTTKYNCDPRHRIRGLKSFLSRYIALFVPYPLIVKKIWILSGSATLFFLSCDTRVANPDSICSCLAFF